VRLLDKLLLSSGAARTIMSFYNATSEESFRRKYIEVRVREYSFVRYFVRQVSKHLQTNVENFKVAFAALIGGVVGLLYSLIYLLATPFIIAFTCIHNHWFYFVYRRLEALGRIPGASQYARK